MKVGIYFFPTSDGATITEVAIAVEARGFDALFVPEHSHFPATATSFADPLHGRLPERYRRIYDPFAALAAAAAVTERIRLGTGACVLPIRDVLLTAKAAATVDRISDGRLDFGVGSGWNFEELRTHGVDPKRRLEMLREGVLAVTELWTKEEAEFHGELYDFPPVWLWPKPIQRPRPPIYVCGHGRAAVERVLDYGDGWLPTYRGGHDIKALSAELRERAAELGQQRPPVTYLIETGTPDAIEQALELDVDRILVPVEPGPRTTVEETLDRLAGALVG